MKFVIILILRFYRYFISPLLGHRCRYRPTCSHYAIEAFQSFPFFRACLVVIKRLFKCHPWSNPGWSYEPLPQTQRRDEEYE